MCFQKYQVWEGGTEREKLERAIKRLECRPWCEDATIALDAARKHLATLPQTKTVARWCVTYWSLTSKYTVCLMTEDEAHADRLVKSNGSTARKHALTTLEWERPPS